MIIVKSKIIVSVFPGWPLLKMASSTMVENEMYLDLVVQIAKGCVTIERCGF